MKTSLAIFGIILLIGGVSGYQFYFGSSTDSLNPIEVAKGATEKVRAFANLICGGSITAGLVISFLLYRGTFGKKLAHSATTRKFVLIAISPALLCFISSFFKSPFQLQMMIAEFCGLKNAPIALAVVAAIAGLILYGVINRTLRNKPEEPVTTEATE